MDNDAVLMPLNDALAVEYQGGYGTSRGDRDILNVVDYPTGQSFLCAQSASILEKGIHVTLR